MSALPRKNIALLIFFVCSLVANAVDLDDAKTLHVHIVPHTHDDVGWLKTVDQYYYGRNNTIQHAHVQKILDTVVEELIKNSNRTFTYVESKFFSMWWDEQSKATKTTVRNLVDKGQLVFVNGGWCMHDEATTHFMGMIDQSTLGHSFLKRELGVIPTVGWQLDPFGHSATQASLFTTELGFNALYFGRIDYQDLQIRHDTQECEGLWTSSPNLDSTVFFGLTGSYGGNYGDPGGFCFDRECGKKDRLVGLDDAHLVVKIEELLGELKTQSDRTKDNNIMLTMGSDFQYEEASINFENLDLLIDSVLRFQADGLIDVPSAFAQRFERINIFYSNPELYTKAKHAFTTKYRALYHKDGVSSNGIASPWSVKNDDFFPYADCPNCYWTGYFTSRTSLKRLERVSSSFLLAARQMESIRDDLEQVVTCEEGCEYEGPLYDLDDAVGILQHHDGVSGTAKQHVADDYADRVKQGFEKASKYFEQKLKRLLLKDSHDDINLNLRSCHIQSDLLCDIAEVQISTKDVFIVVYNSLASRRSSVIGIPVSARGQYQVTLVHVDESTDSNEEKTMPTSVLPQTRSKYSERVTTIVYFDTGPLPPIGASVYRLKIINSSDGSIKSENTDSRISSSLLRGLNVELDGGPESLGLSNGFISAHFNSSTGAIESISSAEDDGVTIDLSQDWGSYSSFATSGTGQNAGAYIFRPGVPDEEINIVAPLKGKAKVIKTDVVMEVHMEFEQSWIKQVSRMYYGQPYLEVEYTIGPIPIDDCFGKEIVTRYSSSSIHSNKEFYTDSNGREFLKRRRSFRPSWKLDEHEPIAGNYYPINSAAYIEDERASLAVVVDRSQGGSSLTDGSLEFMVQRRVLADDNRGVGEPLNETTCGVTPYPPYGDATRAGEGVVITGKHRILVGKGFSGAHLARSQMDKAFSEPLVLIAASSEDSELSASSFQKTSFSALEDALPDNIMLVTFSLLHAASHKTFLIRLGHQYGKGEDDELSKPVRIDMKRLFAGYEVLNVVEKTLSGNRDYSDWENSRLEWNDDFSSRRSVDGVVELEPMQIRTFEVQVNDASSIES